MTERAVVTGRLAAWAVRLTFGAVFFALSEVMLWDRPAPAEWPGRALGCVLLAALAIELMVRFRVNDVPGLIILGGVFGVPYGVLVAQVVGDDLMRGMVLRPLGWFSLVGGGVGIALALLMLRGARFSILRAGVAASLGVLWGAWVHWFPAQLEGGAPVRLELALAAGAASLAGIGAVAYAGRWVKGTYEEHDLMLVRWEWGLVLGGMGVLLVAGLSQGTISLLGLGALAVVGAFLLGVLRFTRTRYRRSALRAVIPPRPLNVPHYTVLVIVFLAAAAIGHSVPAIGRAEEPAQVAALITALYLLGFSWIPAVSIAVAVRAFIEMSRLEG